ncbi:DUF445 domain-containing protein [Synechococcus sp. PCC 6312]|uniref:DUF445 domain-containing protein n=1 Tax=Synechococcus sp. (strain ATCC 27167 / PCC 6312) TaxID=195253 RepID=UPI00029EDFB9|nr:DUF445 family protein [Synechococcus sp. PCC 6312]AFY62189.1 hypothetical protein Syn6312_3140 [Synechococcus sp. PCC 6312]
MVSNSLINLIVPPIAGGVIGYFTNDLAISMLFKPYRPVKIGDYQLPFTPGLIPRNQERLARRIADAILGSLLTPEELENLARRLLQTERVKAAIFWLLELTLEQVKSQTEQRSAQVLANILRDLFGQSLPRLVKAWARRNDFLETQLNQIFDQVLVELQFSEDQAGKLADWLLQVVLPPDRLRIALIDFLTDRNIEILDERLREKTSGTYWILANLFGARNTLVRLRDYCVHEREECNQRLGDLIIALGIRERLLESLQNITLQSLPIATTRQLRVLFQHSVRDYIQRQGLQFVQGFSQTVDWDHMALTILNRLKSSTTLTQSLAVVSEDLALVLERYLERDLEMIVEKAIPILDLDTVIMERVKATSPENLEAAIQGIVKTELQAIVNLGGVLGFLIGLGQTLFLAWQG